MIWKPHIKTIIRSIQSPRIKNVKWNWVSRGSGHDCYSLSGFAFIGIHNQFDSLLLPFTIIDNFIFEHVFWKWSKCVRKADMDGENTEHVCKQWRYCTVPCYPSHVELAQSLIGVNAAAVQWLRVGFSETKASIKGVCCL